MMKYAKATILVMGAMVFMSSIVRAQNDVFVRANGAHLARGGKSFRAIGFNQPDLFSALLTDDDAGRRKSFAAIEDAARSEVCFLRFWASGFWPRDMKLYFEDNQAYWTRMDEVFTHARKHDVMLVPSIFWMKYLWSDLCDEPLGSIVDPKSRTYSAMRTYATELISRYKNDPNVLMWELGNEYFLAADLDAGVRPNSAGAGAKHLGTRPQRSREDSLTTAMLRSFYTNMTTHIHNIDPNHLVTSGDSGPRPTSRSLRESFPKAVWEEDSLEEHLASLWLGQPRPLDILCIHYYGNLTGAFPPETKAARVGGLSIRGPQLLTAQARAVSEAGRPLFVGELGQHDPYLNEDPKARFLLAAIDLLEEEGADLIGIWVWHFPQHKQHNATGSTYAALMKRIGEFNRNHAQMGGPREED